MIREERVPPGSKVKLTPPEVSAYVQGFASDLSGHGVRNLKVQLLPGGAKGTAVVDFSKARGPNTEGGLIWRTLLSGERPVELTARVRPASAGYVIVDVENLTVSGLEMSGGTLDFMITNLLNPHMPGFRFGEPVELEHNVERLDFSATGVQISIKR